LPLQRVAIPMEETRDDSSQRREGGSDTHSLRVEVEPGELVRVVVELCRENMRIASSPLIPPIPIGGSFQGMPA